MRACAKPSPISPSTSSSCKRPRGETYSRPARRRACVEHIRSVLTVSERCACRALGQHRSTQRKAPRSKEGEEQLTADLVELARQYGRYGYRKISALLRDAGWR